MPVTGDYGKLEAWERLLDSGEALLDATSAAMAEETIDLIKQGFRSETDPYGKRWKRKKRPDGRKVLSGPTSRLKGGWSRQQSDSGGFIVAPSVDYAAPHQAPRVNPATGQLKRPRRMMVPTTEKGLPKKWAEAYEDVATAAMKAHFTLKLGTLGARGSMSVVAARIGAIKRQLGVRALIRKALQFGDGDDG